MLLPNELHYGGEASVELAFHNFPLDIVAKNGLTIRKLFQDILSRHQHVHVVGPSSCFLLQ